MEYFSIAKWIITILSYIILLISLLPFFRSRFWFIRIFDYPRAQKFWINAVLILTWTGLADLSQIHDLVLIIALGANQLYLLTLIWPYTPISSRQMQKNKMHHTSSIKLFIANVYQENNKKELCKGVIKNYDPDLVLLVETNEQWAAAMDSLHEQYPYSILRPQENTYGILLYSRLEIINHTVRCLIEDGIPSISAEIKTRKGEVFKLYGLHPRPPVPGETEESTERDAEILIIGKEAKDCALPVIVAGDLNDVAWSYTTRLFLKVSGLLDPRRGRGFYSTFHARYWFFRWPLDHVFCSSHFYLQKLERLPSIGSDHFPIFIQVALMPVEVKENKEEEEHADADDKEFANEVIEAAQH